MTASRAATIHASAAGLGHVIIYGQTIFSMALVMTSVALLTAMAAAMYAGVYLLERRLLRNRQA